MSVFKFLMRFRFWLFREGDTFAYDNKTQLNEVGTKGPPKPIPDRPEFTLSAFVETGQAESTIPVLKQRSYTSTAAIPSALANTGCADLGVDGVWEKLNATFRTSETLGSKLLHLLGIKPDQLRSLLEPYIARNDDFGTIYAHLWPYWHYHGADADADTIKHGLHTQEEADREMRRMILVDDWITT
ncbi:uncharacterized protein ARMOST_06106 [Armillaria ostoyae]|uniref:Uncharacterized protein n=1 Tax=Armillaria ostoyae TaxID=47428 RepID=A0A284R236_ARMOS|nr:uncharacterized protein ARMOST_06106 [Armillaria ostoyae]